jgi:hypothetical protein
VPGAGPGPGPAAGSGAGPGAERALVGAALLAALLPVAPTPLTTGPAIPTPHCFAGTGWRRHLPVGATVLVLPFDFDTEVAAMRWQAHTGIRFRIVGGYFLGPSRAGGPGLIGPDVTSTTWRFFARPADWRGPRPVSDADRAGLRREVRRWGVYAVLLAQGTPHADAIRATAERVYGPARQVDDVWFWPAPAG